MLRPFLGLRSSRFECLKRFYCFLHGGIRGLQAFKQSRMIMSLPGPTQFKLRMPQAIPRFPGSESSGELHGVPGSSGDLREAPKSL
eukprot:2099247-Alexandrium_andersonii.AAC.1